MREQDREQRKSTWEMKEKFADEQRKQSEEQLRRTQEEMALRMGKQEDELRRRQQENSLFMQVHTFCFDVHFYSAVYVMKNLVRVYEFL